MALFLLLTGIAVSLREIRLGRLEEREKEKLAAMKAFVSALDARDPYTKGHSLRVAEYALRIGRAMGLDKKTLEHIKIAALMHDIGKICVPDAVLRKSGKLDDSEWTEMKKHPLSTAEILSGFDSLKSIVDLIRWPVSERLREAELDSLNVHVHIRAGGDLPPQEVLHEKGLMKVRIQSSRCLRLTLLFAGAVAGYLVFHPYLMIAYTLGHMEGGAGSLFHGQWKSLFDVSLSAFGPFMLPMGISFALFGALAGFLVGVIVDKRRRLYALEIENEKKKAALETFHQLLVTVSHYLLNANTIIGGMVRHCRRIESNCDVLSSLETIEQQARKIDAVVAALRRVKELRAAQYTSAERTLMIDIAQELEAELTDRPEEPTAPGNRQGMSDK